MDVEERRRNARVLPGATPWDPRIVLRPGHEITVLDIGPGGMRIQTRARVLPGKGVELQLVRDGNRRTVAGHVLRCRVASLAPLTYEAALATDECLEMGNAVG